MTSYTFEMTQALRRDVARAITFQYYTARRMVWMSLLVLYLGLLIGVMLFIYLSVLGIGPIILISLVFSVGLVFAISYLQTRIGMARMAKVIGPTVEVKVGARKLYWGSSQVRSEYAYERIQKLVLLESVALLFLSDRLFLFAPVTDESLPVLERISNKLQAR